MSAVQFPGNEAAQMASLVAAGKRDHEAMAPADVKSMEDLKIFMQKNENLDKKALLKAAQDFESFFLYKLMQAMRKTVPENKFMHGGKWEEVFRDMQDEETTKEMSKAGGIGLADMLYKQLSEKLEHTYTPEQVLRNKAIAAVQAQQAPEETKEK